MKSRRERAWECWLKIAEKIEESGCYFHDEKLCMGEGVCGGDFANIIEKYI